MKYLFIHQNFPGQYRHVVRHLASQPGNQVCFITQPNDNAMPGVHKITYPKDSRGHIHCHAWASSIPGPRSSKPAAGCATADSRPT
jgi:hypothetical protein